MKFIIVGLGFWGQTWTKVLEQHAQAGIVAVEKPLATSMEDAVEIADGAERSGAAKLMVAQGYRFTDGAGRVRELVGAGEIGTLRSVRVTFRKNLPDHLPPEHSIYSWRHGAPVLEGCTRRKCGNGHLGATSRETTRADALPRIGDGPARSRPGSLHRSRQPRASAQTGGATTSKRCARPWAACNRC